MLNWHFRQRSWSSRPRKGRTYRFRPQVEELENRLVLSPPGAGWEIVLADEFNGTSLNTSLWQVSTGPRRQAVNTTNALSVADGNLTITTYTQGGTHYTGFIGTWTGFLGTFGYWEARIKFQDSPGMWSAFWLQSPTMGNPIGNPAVAGTEIDIAEHRSRDAAGADVSNKVQHNIHWDGYGPSHQSVGALTNNPGGTPLQGNFHTYGVLWTPTGYQFYVDNVLRWSTSQAVSHRSEFIYLTSEVQGNSWAGPIPPSGYGSLTSSQTKMTVDWVRVHRRPPTISPIVDLATNEDTATPAVPFTVTNPDALSYTLARSSSNTNLVPTGNIQFGGSGSNRTVTVTPTPGQTGRATVTVTATSGTPALSSSESFTLTVQAGSFANAGFEDNPAGIGWSLFGTAQVVNFNQRSGSRAMRMNGASGSAEQVITGLSPDTTYTLGGWQRVSFPSAEARIGVKNYGGPDVWSATHSTGYVNGTVIFTTGPGSTQATVYVSKPVSGNAADFDDLYVFRAPTIAAQAGTFRNIGFEEDPPGVGWSRSGSAQVVNFNQRSGSRALRADGSSGAAEQLITDLEPNTTYTLGGWLRVSNAAATAEIGVKNYGGPDLSASTSNTGYTYLSIPFTTGPDSTQATVYVRKPTSSHAADFDDLDLFLEPSGARLPNRTTDEDTPTSPIQLRIGNASSAAGSWTLEATSSNTTLVPTENLVLSGSGLSRNLQINPAADEWGNTTISVTVSDAYGGSVTSSFVLTVNSVNDAPVLAPLADQTMTASQDILTVPLSATDVDGDSLTFSAVVRSLAYVLDQQLGLSFAGDYYENMLGRGEKWMIGDGGIWYFVLPNGELYRDDGTLMGNVGASYWANPSLLHDAQPDQPHAVIGIVGSDLIIDLEDGFVGSLVIWMTASDGLLTDTKAFRVIVTV
jgi:beta-glucanase (GH16 family)